MQDVLTSLLYATEFDSTIAQSELERINSLNPDIVEFRVAKREGSEIIPLAAVNKELVGIPEQYPQLFMDSMIRLDESIIFAGVNEEGREWHVYRAMERGVGDYYFIYTKVSFKAIDELFASSTRDAMVSLVFIYIFVAGLAYWHIRQTDYHYLYSEVQKANEMKDLFTNMIAHELRAPLTAIRGYSSMIEEKADGPEKEHSIRIRESSERLIAIVNDLLDVARIQSGKLSTGKEEVNVSAVVLKVLDELAVSGQEKSISLVPEGTRVPHLVVADQKRFHQALTNLVSNAIKYTKEGSIKVAIEDKREQVEIRVKDTGMGISSDDQKKLFAPFFRVASNDVSQITGTGLGMWITKQLIELMNGQISVESIKGVGTHIVVTFPKSAS